MGGRSGSIRSEDGIIELPLALPKTMGGKGAAPIRSNSLQPAYSASSRMILMRSDLPSKPMPGMSGMTM
jgi:hypothetical protein